MKKRLSSMVISVAMIFALTTGAFAADPSSMEDIDGHWGRESIGWCMERDLLRGMSDTTFEPNTAMTRGMFVVVLGRIAGIYEEDYLDSYLATLYTDVRPDQYYAAAINWATRYGIVNGMGGGGFWPDQPITREQMATMVIRFASIYNYELLTVDGIYTDAFSDSNEISDYAVSAVESLRNTGVLNGIPAEDGSHYFAPQKTATRAECAAVFQRLVGALNEYEGRVVVDPVEFWLESTSAEMKLGESMPLIATIIPQDTTNQTITWVSMDPTIASVDANGYVTAVGEGTVEIYGYTWNGLNQSCTVTCRREASVAGPNESYEDKCLRVFGEVTDEYRTYYDINDTSYLVTVPVQVWDFTDRTHTEKYTKTIYLQVHKNLADTFQAIFAEIYNGDEQFPIYSAGGYYRSSYSEHTPGLAVDINPNENYECYLDGTPMTGSYWKPGEDPYSIPADGDVVQAFRNHGFGWGGDWRTKKDYMHFSYFGT